MRYNLAVISSKIVEMGNYNLLWVPLQITHVEFYWCSINSSVNILRVFDFVYGFWAVSC